ncbi:hypothetical protein L2E82_25370 [Cichorium intybus]|uniref:Uncharacterized protein n=1 Tax=Cichorium intybus TaxID=13427 RepID=A0ACB9E335_CICIN|nr:hypothetical protein L2E82_25370 [Cichorium intybus]
MTRMKANQTHEEWLPITRSGKGNSWTTCFAPEFFVYNLHLFQGLGNSVFVCGICMAALYDWVVSEYSRIRPGYPSEPIPSTFDCCKW